MMGGGKAFKNGFIVAGGWFIVAGGVFANIILFPISYYTYTRTVCSYCAILHMY